MLAATIFLGVGTDQISCWYRERERGEVALDRRDDLDILAPGGEKLERLEDYRAGQGDGVQDFRRQTLGQELPGPRVMVAADELDLPEVRSQQGQHGLSLPQFAAGFTSRLLFRKREVLRINRSVPAAPSWIRVFRTSRLRSPRLLAIFSLFGA